MSDFFFCIIPIDPNCIISDEVTQKVKSLIHNIIKKCDEIKVSKDKSIQFRDCGENFESVCCPYCNEEIEIVKWQEIMELDYSESLNGFKMNSYMMRCCNKDSNLNDLNYSWNQGFSKYEISIMNPDMAELSIDDFQKIRNVIGTDIKVIYQHI